MNKFSILVGNDINNVIAGNSWAELLKGLTQNLDIRESSKPFPLLYEEIFFKRVHEDTSNLEFKLKKTIAEKVIQIRPNSIHKQLLELGTNNILTTNYDLSLEFGINDSIELNKITNDGKVIESKYSIFRHHIIEKKNIWHIHGAANDCQSITLGYEHYCGYLQNMRNYVVSGTGNSYKKNTFSSLIRRLNENDKNYDSNLNNHTYTSWIDLFFKEDIHIVGLALDFCEIDLWWLLTYRAKYKCNCNNNIHNSIYYYLPQKYKKSSQDKIDLLQALDVITITISEENKISYYDAVINRIQKKYKA